MRQFANVFLILFLADGAISTLDELLAALSGIHLLIQVRNLASYPVLFLSLPLFICMGFDRRIPKHVFLPMVLYALWAPMMFWPMPLYLPEAGFNLIISFGQLLIGLLGLYAVWRRANPVFFITPDMFSGPGFSWKNTLGFFAATTLLVPLTIAIIGFWSLASLVETRTAGFMKIRPTGLYMNEKIYIKNGKTLRLIPMIHIGRSDYYDAVGDSMDEGKTIILAEGVSDTQGLLKTEFSYDKIGEFLGLGTQRDMELQGTYVTRDFTPLDPSSPIDASKPHIVSADIDLSDFSPTTVDFIGILAAAFFSGGPITEGYTQYTTWIGSKGDVQKTIDTITYDIFTRRNEAIFAMMGKALPHYNTLIIPWGALHMTAVEEETQRLGFILLGKKERLSVDFREALEHVQQMKRYKSTH